MIDGKSVKCFDITEEERNFLLHVVGLKSVYLS